jgi:hypothetical protein
MRSERRGRTSSHGEKVRRIMVSWKVIAEIIPRWNEEPVKPDTGDMVGQV